jgi:lauroyl/myristoyl acyltransferase
VSLGDFLIYGSYRLLGALTGPLPPRVGYSLARGASRLVYVFSPRLRATLRHNMSHVLGPEATEERVDALAREACLNIAKGHYELFRVNRLTNDEIRALIKVEGYEHITQALAQGKGVILITAHLGNMDIIIQLPQVYGVPMTGPVQHIQPERLFHYVLSLRQGRGLRLLPSDGPLMEMFRALKRGEIIGLPCDRAIADNSRVFEFFGSPARLPDGPVRVALRTGAALIPVFAQRLPDDSFLAHVEPPLDLPNTGDREADVATGMEMVIASMERFISAHPEQWLVAVPIWTEE